MSSGPLRLAVFDCDGTLVDSLHVIASAAGHAFGALGLQAPPARDVQAVIGLPLLDALGQIAPEGADLEKLREGYVEAYRALIDDPAMHEPLFAGAIEALEALEAMGVLLGVATGKGRRGLHGVLERHGIAERFVTLKTSDDGPGKPNPHMLRDAMAEAGTGPDETVMIGDTTFDILMAGNAGVASIGVTWGYHDAEALSGAGAARMVSEFDQVPKAFDQLTRR